MRSSLAHLLPLTVAAVLLAGGCGGASGGAAAPAATSSAGVAAASTSTRSSSATGKKVASPNAHCRSDPHAGVHDPSRLTVLNACAELVGTVVRAPKLNPSDQDVTFNVRPDPGYESMMNAKNRDEGGLHVEIVPMDQPGCTPGKPIPIKLDNMGTCSGANVVFPPLGAHVLVVGPFVHDAWVGWNEIHPAWYVEVIPAGGPPPPEQHTAKARLTGSAVPGGTGVRGASAVVRTTLTGTKLCWSFSAIKGISRLGRAEVRSISGGRLAFRLGSRFRTKGCESLPGAKAERFGKNVHAFSVVVYASGRRGAALRGRLAPTSD